MLGRFAHGAPDRPFDQPFQPAALLFHLRKHEAFECGICAIDLDRAGHARRELVAVAEELVPLDRSKKGRAIPHVSFPKSSRDVLLSLSNPLRTGKADRAAGDIGGGDMCWGGIGRVVRKMRRLTRRACNR